MKDVGMARRQHPNSILAHSSSVLDDEDSNIISLTKDRQTTLLSVSERMDIFFVECLHRVQRLQRMGLLKRIEREHLATKTIHQTLLLPEVVGVSGTSSTTTSTKKPAVIPPKMSMKTSCTAFQKEL